MINPIHIKLEYEGALKSKRDILSLQRDLLLVAGKIREYKILRLKELKTKQKLHSKIKTLVTQIKKIQKVLPDEEVSEVLDKETKKEKQKKKTRDIESPKDIESQLREIQRKLKALE